MKTLHLISNYAYLRDPDLEQQTAAIISAMSQHHHQFPELSAMVGALYAAHTAFTAAVAALKTCGGKVAKEIRDARRTILLCTLHELCATINRKAKGNRRLLEATGGLITRDPEARLRHPAPPDILKIRSLPGTSTATVCISSVAGAAAYLYQYAPVPAQGSFDWVALQLGSTILSVGGLRCGRRYAFRAAAIGRDPALRFSGILTCHIRP